MAIRKYATAEILDVHGGPRHRQRLAHRANFTYDVRPGFLYVRSRAVSSRTNDNYDTFMPEELRAAWPTYVGKPAFVNHYNDDIRRFRGVNIAAELHDDVAPDGSPDVWIETLMEIDAERYPLLGDEIVSGHIARTSMGCDVQSSECSVCGNVARVVSDFCTHVEAQKGSRVRKYNAAQGRYEDVLVHEMLRGIAFFENSLLVEEPADPTAHLYGLDDRGLSMTASRSPGIPEPVTMLHLSECPVCAQSSWDSEGRCGDCGYIIPPAPFADPDLDVAQRVDTSGESFSQSLMAAPPFIP